MARRATGWVLSAASLAPLAVVIAGCPGSDVTPIEDLCVTGAALSAAPITGASLGAKELSLTFDDGPGSRTLELSAYLKARGIGAAFFVNGHCFPGQGGNCGNTQTAAVVLAQLVADGHLVANHTQTHANLTSISAQARVEQLAETDAIIAPFVPAERFLFRAPFGAWNNGTYATLSASAMDKYVGHVDWDVGGVWSGDDATGYAADWYCWQTAAATSARCGARYINEVNAVGKGIVLFHDADYGDVANTNPNAGLGNTVDMVKYMVPLLEAAGYTFKRLDEVPAIAALLPPLPPSDAGTADATVDDAADATTPDDASSDEGGPSTPPGTKPSPPGDASVDPCAVEAAAARRTAHAL
jgi:peptidoglycan-N-acetylglucosamine deacetylase